MPDSEPIESNDALQTQTLRPRGRAARGLRALPGGAGPRRRRQLQRRRGRRLGRRLQHRPTSSSRATPTPSVDVYQRTYDAGVGAYVTREVSAGPTGGNDAYDATFQGISANGREIYFSTQEPLVEADGDKSSVDVYAHDTVTGQTVLVSRAASSCEGPPAGNGSAPATYKGSSADGQRVFFETTESLAPADGDEASDVYVRDLAAEPPTTTLVSRPDASCSGSAAAGPGAAAETFVGASSDGSEVFFETTESLASGDEVLTSDDPFALSGSRTMRPRRGASAPPKSKRRHAGQDSATPPPRARASSSPAASGIPAGSPTPTRGRTSTCGKALACACLDRSHGRERGSKPRHLRLGRRPTARGSSSPRARRSPGKTRTR